MSPICPPSEEAVAEEERIRLAVIGRPNVGKSSWVNSILGFERVLVSSEPGTTRDVIDTPFDYRGRGYLLIDTAGIRRKARIAQRLEKFAVLEAIKGIDQCDLAVILLDAVQGVTDQDARVAGLAFEKGKGCIIGVNKWDLIEKNVKNKKQFIEDIRYHLKYLSFAPILPLSALTGLGREKLLNTIHQVYLQYTRRVGTGPSEPGPEKNPFRALSALKRRPAGQDLFWDPGGDQTTHLCPFCQLSGVHPFFLPAVFDQ